MTEKALQVALDYYTAWTGRDLTRR